MISNNYRILAALTSLINEEQVEFFGVVDLDLRSEADRLRGWLAEGRHAEMKYLTRDLQIRTNPEQLLPGAKCAIIIGLPYHLKKTELSERPHPAAESEGEVSSSADLCPKIASYACLPDYHRFFSELCEKIARGLRDTAQNLGVKLTTRVVSDKYPLLERALAAKTAQGFIGKNTCFIHPKKGSYFLLAEILVDYSLPLDSQIPLPHGSRHPTLGGCGTCRRCQIHCPTNALSQDYSLDARFCLAYWTIEHRGLIPKTFWPYFADFLFGCDRCQNVCPYNRGSKESYFADLQRIAVDRSGYLITTQLNQRVHVTLHDIATMSQESYELWFGGTALTRAKRRGLRRNALIAMHARREPSLSKLLASLILTEKDELVLKTALQLLEDFSK